MPCVRYYRTIRAGVSGPCRQLGYGVNRRPVPAAVTGFLARLYADVVTHRVVEYDDAGLVPARTLVGELLGQYLGIAPLAAEQVQLFHGSTEAISFACEYAAYQGVQPVLPIPNYYSFEHSLSRYGAVEPVYYGTEGQLDRPVPTGRRRMLVDVAPNGVLGSWLWPPPPADPDDLALIDVPFSLPQFDRVDDFRAVLYRKMTAYPRWLLCMTPSKDLSVPGLRVGFLAGTEPGFAEFAAAVRFERGYSVHAAVALVVAAHLGLLLLALADRVDRAATSARLRELFDRHGVPFLDHREEAMFLTEMAAATRHFARNIDLLDECGLFEPLAGASRPVAGYSTFRWLARSFPSPDDYTRWVNRLGHAGMKVNPNYLFGAAPEYWHRLYPDRYGIRLNISVPATELRDNLRFLRRQLDA
ncbi:DNA-binding transcriptional regulator, MocR family, contains an aminotransferase domain [Micromonospora pallida]|uniref:DNA-binding transcriptional regulator, MocR family, contains an aminotransferase domain n=1 Tax=Micromonospora pallida TaxID=145854 RepID=A0A1C6S9P5_9ACTN|nr:aminotransferase class I/II-fold pyridoxal phosphate-dependent enzyme [Micromonospora pallida]SCL26195.1 DNA-binding transcriptional regulator, MocR family, contains an aminotransferase domain [Micromonospora pallida]